jgi:DNA-binding transcriptional regulator YhcF (GntR family)
MNFILDLEQKQTIKNGIIKNFGSTEFTVLLTIQAFTNIQMESAFPSQQTIANLTGLSVPTVRRAIKSLEDRGVISRNRKDIKSVTNYTFNNADDNVNTIEHIESITTNDQTSKKYNTSEDFFNDFSKRYLQTYNVQYVSNQRGDLSQIKSKLIDKFTDEQLDAILTITFRDYNLKWSNKEYPRPVIGGICTFIARKALDIWEEEKAKEIKLEEAEQIDLDKYFRNQTF